MNLAVVKISVFRGTETPDKNGLMPVILLPIAGAISQKSVLSGSVALQKGFEIGKVYLVRVLLRGKSLVHGDDYDYESLSEPTGLEIIQLTEQLGEGRMIPVEKTELSKEYVRKSNAVESERTREIKAGTYIPATMTSSRNHETAKEVVKGSSQFGEVVEKTREIEKENFTQDEGDDMPNSLKKDKAA